MAKLKLKLQPYFLLIFLFSITFGLGGCRDYKKQTISSQFIDCQEYVYKQEWKNVIKACEGLQIIQAKLNIANAYTNQSGIQFQDIVDKLMSGSKAGLTISDVYQYLDKVDANQHKLKMALEHFFDPLLLKYLQEKEPDDNGEGLRSVIPLEAALISGMLVLNSLKKLIDLRIDKMGAVTYCDPTECSFFPTIKYSSSLSPIPESITFPGIPQDFYDGLCDASHTVTQPDLGASIFTMHINIAGCLIQDGSILYYNKLAYKFLPRSSRVTFPIINKFDYVTNIDNGHNLEFTKILNKTGTISINSIPASVVVLFPQYVCDVTLIPVQIDDGQITDCEFFNYFLNIKF